MGKVPRRAPAGGGTGRRVWVAKADKANDQIEDEQEEDAAAESEENKPITSPLVLEPNPGPIYKRDTLLRTQKLIDKEETLGVKYSLGERPPVPDEDPNERLRGKRQRQQDKRKEQKAAEQLKNEDAGPEAEASAEPGVESQDMAAQMMPLSSMMDPTLMQYLQAMAFSPYVGYGAQPPGQTTVMLRNIPNRYSRDMLLEKLSAKFEGAYDFVYLPIDFNSKCNVGYAFINFRTSADCERFFTEFHNVRTKQCLPGYSSNKVCQVSYARVQGRDANLENLRDEKFLEKLIEKREWQPLFYDDQGNELPFESLVGNATSGRGRRRSSYRSSGDAASAMQPIAAAAAAAAAMTGYMAPPAPPPQTHYTLKGVLKRVLPNAGNNTLLLLRNVPTKLTSAQLSECLNRKHTGSYDFIWALKDGKKEESKGEAFLNFKSQKKAQAFVKTVTEGDASSLLLGDGEAGGATGSQEATPEKALEVASAKVGQVEGELIQYMTVTKKGTDMKGWCPLIVSTKGEATDFPFHKAQADLPQVPLVGRTPSDAAAAHYAAFAGQQGYFGYPYAGYPNYAYGAAAAQWMAYQTAQASMIRAQQAAATHQAQHNAAQGSAPSFNPSEEAKALGQMEYYFSDDNLCKDTYLRSLMDADGWIDLSHIMGFNKMKDFEESTVIKAISESLIVEVETSTKRVRLKQEAARKRWASLRETPSAANAETAGEAPPASEPAASS